MRRTTKPTEFGGRVVLLPSEMFVRLEELREQTGKESIIAVIYESAELYARWRNVRELEAYSQLTPRLREILRLIASGMSTKDIAASLDISKKTVEFHRARLTKQLGLRPTALLARYAARVGAVPP